jgi:translation initiation factor 2D
MSFRPEKKIKEPADQKDNANTTPSSDASHAVKSQLVVVEVYKPTTHVNPIFISVGADTSSYYSSSEASDVVFRFVRIFIC